MNEQPAIPVKQHDIALANVLTARALNHYGVAGENRWQHAPSCHPETQPSRRAQHVARQLTFQGVQIGPKRWLDWHHDADWFKLHPLWVLVILPHDKAVVTKTCSWRKAGFSYGFLSLAALRGCSEDESFIGIRLTPVILAPIAMLVPHSHPCHPMLCKSDCFAFENISAKLPPQCPSQPYCR
jgi:hypothetical protein